jgi:hypothetical protein
MLWLLRRTLEFGEFQDQLAREQTTFLINLRKVLSPFDFGGTPIIEPGFRFQISQKNQSHELRT